MKKLLLTTALITSFGISAANATSVNSVVAGQDNLLSDNSAESLINAGNSSDTIVDVGDRLRGILNIGTVENSNGNTNLGSAGVNELTAIFDITVMSKSCGTGGLNCTFEFGPTASFQAELAAWGFSYGGSDAMIAFFEDSTPDYDRGAGGVPTIAAAEATATDGNAYWLFGLDNVDDYWRARSDSDDIAAITIPNFDFGDLAAALTMFENPTGMAVASDRICATSIGGFTVATADVCALGNLLTPTGATPFQSFDDVNFTISSVPEPATLGLLGLGLMGIGFAARRRKQS